MTIPAHAIISAIVTAQFFSDWRVILIAAILGTVNDMVRIIKKEGWGESYLYFHKPTEYLENKKCGTSWFFFTVWFFVIFYPIGLHWLIDKFWHKKEGGWYWWGKYVEAIFWCAILEHYGIFKYLDNL